ncbi:MAG: hypothetical protein U9P44_03645, partial [archaeon]|nr:hypothetical protein [archaeon]
MHIQDIQKTDKQIISMKHISKTQIMILIIITTLTMLNTQLYAISFGAAPSSIIVGEQTRDGRTVVYPGKDYAIEYFILTNSQNNILVHLSYMNPHNDIYSRKPTRYPFEPTEASQEPIKDWLNFKENP